MKIESERKKSSICFLCSRHDSWLCRVWYLGLNILINLSDKSNDPESCPIPHGSHSLLNLFAAAILFFCYYFFVREDVIFENRCLVDDLPKNRKCLSWQPSKSHFSSKFDRTFQFLCFFPALVHPETSVDPFPVEREAPFGGIRSDSALISSAPAFTDVEN